MLPDVIDWSKKQLPVPDFFDESQTTKTAVIYENTDFLWKNQPVRSGWRKFVFPMLAKRELPSKFYENFRDWNDA